MDEIYKSGQSKALLQALISIKLNRNKVKR